MDQDMFRVDEDVVGTHDNGTHFVLVPAGQTIPHEQAVELGLVKDAPKPKEPKSKKPAPAADVEPASEDDA